jgi:hypothetical protein
MSALPPKADIRPRMSALGQLQTYALQQNLVLFDHPVRSHQE